MYNFSKKDVSIRTAPLFVILFFCFCKIGLSQTTTPENSKAISVSISAEVKNSMELVTIRNMIFKDVRPSQREVYISPVTDGNAGQMKATGAPNARVRVSFFPNSKIYHSTSNSSIDFNYLVAVNSENNQTTSELINSDSRIFEMNSEGELFLWVGGRVDLSTIQPGNYTGDFVLEVEYL